jgi:hypothetical protein
MQTNKARGTEAMRLAEYYLFEFSDSLPPIRTLNGELEFFWPGRVFSKVIEYIAQFAKMGQPVVK